MEESPHKLEILIVEDSSTQSLFLQKSLNSLGYQVRSAADGKEGLAQIKQKRPAVVVTDINMPNMDGFELCTTIRQDSKLNDLPVILLTALTDPKEVINGINCHADYFLTKPCNIDLLHKIIQDCMKSGEWKRQSSEIGVVWDGERMVLHADTSKLSSLLLSTYLNMMLKNTELQGAERNLRDNNMKLKAANEQKNHFLSMASHDLRNPLTSILLFCDLLKEENINPKIVDSIQHAAKNMLNIVTGLLDISLIEAGQVRLNLALCRLDEMAKRCVSGNSPLAQKKQIQLNLKIDGEIPEIECDEPKVEQVLTNLLTNAMKYSPPNSEVHIHLSVIPQQKKIILIL